MPITPLQAICDELRVHVEAIDTEVIHVDGLRRREEIDPELSAALIAAKKVIERETSALWAAIYHVDPHCDWCGKRIAQQGQKHPECLKEEACADEAEDRQIREMEQQKEQLFRDRGFLG